MINAAGGGVRSRDSPTMMCRAEVTGSLVPTVAKQIQSVEPETNTQSCKEIQRILSQRRSILYRSVSTPALATAQRQTNHNITAHLWAPLNWAADQRDFKPRGGFASDLLGWFRCEASREAEFPLESLDFDRCLSVFSRSARGWSHWTFRRRRRTPPCTGSPTPMTSCDQRSLL